MTIKQKPTRSETKRFIDNMRAMKANEQANGVGIFTDNLLKVCCVVRHGADWWLVPRSRDGWQRRQRLRLTPEVRLERLKPASIDASWLGIGDGGQGDG